MRVSISLCVRAKVVCVTLLIVLTLWVGCGGAVEKFPSSRQRCPELNIQLQIKLLEQTNKSVLSPFFFLSALQKTVVTKWSATNEHDSPCLHFKLMFNVVEYFSKS